LFFQQSALPTALCPLLLHMYKMPQTTCFAVALQDISYEQLFTACDTRASDKDPAVAVSVWGEQYTMGVHEVSQLSLKEFCTLWTDYVRKLAEYLLQVPHALIYN